MNLAKPVVFLLFPVTSGLGSLTPQNEPRKKPVNDIPLYWLVDRNPHNGLLESLCHWVV